jgi:hypothetical protein
MYIEDVFIMSVVEDGILEIGVWEIGLLWKQ